MTTLRQGAENGTGNRNFFQQGLKKHNTVAVFGTASGHASGDGGYACGQLCGRSGGIRGVSRESV